MQAASSAQPAQPAAPPAAAPPMARGALRAPRKDGEGLRSILANVGGRRKGDATKTTTFSPSAEGTQISPGEEDEEPRPKKKAPAASKGIVATLLSPVNALANQFKSGKVDSLEIMRKRRSEKEDEDRPFPVQPCLAVCLAAILIGALTIYALIGSPSSKANTMWTAGTPSTENDTKASADMPKSPELDGTGDEEARPLDELYHHQGDADEVSSEPFPGETMEDTGEDAAGRAVTN